MDTKTTITENYFYNLLKRNYHTSEIIRTQIAEIKEKTQSIIQREPLKGFTVKFQGQVVGYSFEKTLKIIAKRLFSKGKVNNIKTLKEQNSVEVDIMATQTEVEELIRFLMKRHGVLHYKKGAAKGISNMLIIDENEQNQLGNFIPDSLYFNYSSYVEASEKYTGRLDDYLILNGLPLTTEKLGRELRFNKIETKNKVFTSTGLKEIYLNLHFITLILMLDLEEHYLKLRIFREQERTLKSVEEKIDNLGFFADIFHYIANEDNPLLFNKSLFIDLMRIEHIIEKEDWKSLPAYAGYIYSATSKLNEHFKLMEEYNLFLTYANCIEKFLSKLQKKLFKPKSDFKNEHNNLNANYNELKKLQIISNHPPLKNIYQDILNSFSKLLAYVDFMSIDNKSLTAEQNAKLNTYSHKKTIYNFTSIIKKITNSVFGHASDISINSFPAKNEHLAPGQESDAQKLIDKLKSNLQKLSQLKTASGADAYLEARKCVPLLTHLSDILDQLNEIMKKDELGKDTQDLFKNVFVKTNKFTTLFNELSNLVTFDEEEEKESIRKILIDLQKLLYNKPLKEVNYVKIIDNINALENFVISKNKLHFEKVDSIHSFTQKMNQKTIFKNIIDIKTELKKIIETEKEFLQIDTFKKEEAFFSYSSKELSSFLEEIIKFNKKLKASSYWNNKSNFEAIEKEFDQLIKEVNDIENRIASNTRKENNLVLKETVKYVDYLKSSVLAKRNLEKAIILIQNQISQILGFISAIKDYLKQKSFVHSGVSTSVLFDQITFLLSNIDVKLLDMGKLTEDMFIDCINTISRYQVGETFKEPQNEDIDRLMQEIRKKETIKIYKN
ncbi:MAG: acylphosphatase [Candidatus Kuenenia sp.]|nr:acylphosphatase [Candidatus Kuenenia hertensis]